MGESWNRGTIGGNEEPGSRPAGLGSGNHKAIMAWRQSGGFEALSRGAAAEEVNAEGTDAPIDPAVMQSIRDDLQKLIDADKKTAPLPSPSGTFARLHRRDTGK